MLVLLDWAGNAKNSKLVRSNKFNPMRSKEKTVGKERRGCSAVPWFRRYYHAVQGNVKMKEGRQ